MPKSRVGIRKKQEATFKKKKLKPGHIIKKTNVTDTRFSSKQLSLIEQLQAKNTDILSYRGLTLSELFKQLGHYNLNVRRDAVIGTKELLKNHPGIISKNLMNIIPSVARLIADPKNDSAMHFQLKHLFSLIFQVPESEMTPHFSLFLSHALCGLTHLHRDVKAFALDIICMAMSKYPGLCKKSKDLRTGFCKFITGKKKPADAAKIKSSIDLFASIYVVKEKDPTEPIICGTLNFQNKSSTGIRIIQKKNPFDFPILGSVLCDDEDVVENFDFIK
uniref:Ipi1_N domain-containing protein n=1 Tax=Parastrongyloides trichosuri TaxID=131310 RepID=A0A0N4Z957_PARTI